MICQNQISSTRVVDFSYIRQSSTNVRHCSFITKWKRSHPTLYYYYENQSIGSHKS